MTKRIVEIKYPDNDMVAAADAGELPIKRGDCLILDTDEGEKWATAVDAPIPFERKERCSRPIVGIARIADEKDIKKINGIMKKAEEAQQICVEKVAKHNLPMKIINVDIAMDGSKITFHFAAENRVDFRELVKDLAGVFRTRIELHQVGVRDEARIFGGIGPCGCRLCCTSFIREFQPVSIKMAKEQNLPLNPLKISGICGRLLCCLRYEHPVYNLCRRGLPKLGQMIETPKGPGRVSHVNVLARKVMVENEEGVKWEVEYAETAFEAVEEEPVEETEPTAIEEEDNNLNPDT